MGAGTSRPARVSAGHGTRCPNFALSGGARLGFPRAGSGSDFKGSRHALGQTALMEPPAGQARCHLAESVGPRRRTPSKPRPANSPRSDDQIATAACRSLAKGGAGQAALSDRENSNLAGDLKVDAGHEAAFGEDGAADRNTSPRCVAMARSVSYAWQRVRLPAGHSTGLF